MYQKNRTTMFNFDVIDKVYEEHCSERFPLPTENEIADLEAELSCTFPDHYREYLRLYNGGVFEDVGIDSEEKVVSAYAMRYLMGVNAPGDYARLGRRKDYMLFDDNDPPVAIPIASFSDVSFLMLDIESGTETYGEIHFKKAGGGFYYVCNHMSDLFAMLVKEPWLKG